MTIDFRSHEKAALSALFVGFQRTSTYSGQSGAALYTVLVPDTIVLNANSVMLGDERRMLESLKNTTVIAYQHRNQLIDAFESMRENASAPVLHGQALVDLCFALAQHERMTGDVSFYFMLSQEHQLGHMVMNIQQETIDRHADWSDFTPEQKAVLYYLEQAQQSELDAIAKEHEQDIARTKKRWERIIREQTKSFR